MRDVDEEFQRYLDSGDYDRAEGWLMDIIRATYKAGFDVGQKADKANRKIRLSLTRGIKNEIRTDIRGRTPNVRKGIGTIRHQLSVS